MAIEDIENNAVADVGQRSFVIAALDKIEHAADGLALLHGLGISAKAVRGAYTMQDGTGEQVQENAFVISADDFPTLARSGCIALQESVLVLGPRPDRDGPRPATLHFLPKAGDGRLDAPLPVALGYFLPCSIERAKQEEAYTIDAANDLGFICSFDLDAADEE